MPEVQCWPLWDEEGNNLHPASLGLSTELTERLFALAEAYDQPMDWQDPRNAHWAEEEDFASFKADFWWIAERLQAELGSAVVVVPVQPWF